MNNLESNLAPGGPRHKQRASLPKIPFQSHAHVMRCLMKIPEALGHDEPSRTFSYVRHLWMWLEPHELLSLARSARRKCPNRPWPAFAGMSNLLVARRRKEERGQE